MVRRKREQGFTLIELGIVVAVIAVLATVILFGRGFLESTRISKAVETVTMLQKAANTFAQTGTPPGTVPATLTLANLQARQLVPPNINNAVSGYSFAIARVNQTQYRVTVTCPTNVAATDLGAAKASDPNLVGAPGVAGLVATFTFQI